ncbi:MAG: serine hydrolase domain-containing protein [Bacteroidota bacterium]
MKFSLYFLSFSLIVLLFLSGCKSSDPEPNPPSLSDEITAQLEKLSFVGSYSVVREGEEIAAGGIGYANKDSEIQNTSTTQFRIGSVTKTFTAVAILQLEEAGLLAIDDNLSTYLPDYPNGENIMLKHLLSHTSGIYNFTELTDYSNFASSKRTIDEVIDFFKDEPAYFEPGQGFYYSNSGFILLGKIIEILSESTYAEYIQEHIFTPAGMTNTEYGKDILGIEGRALGYLNSDYQVLGSENMSVPHAAGAIASTTEDLQSWSKAIDDNALITTASKTKMFTDYSNANYGLGWMLGAVDNYQAHYHEGAISGFRSILVKIEEPDITVVILSNKQQGDMIQFFNEVWKTMLDFDKEAS